MKYLIFLSCGLETEEQRKEAEDLLEALKKDPEFRLASFYCPAVNGSVLLDPESLVESRKIYYENLHKLFKAEIVILMAHQGVWDEGAVFEAGLAFRSSKSLIVYDSENGPLNLMIAHSASSYVSDLKSLREALRRALWFREEGFLSEFLQYHGVYK